ncbi:MAG: DinB family protein [Acidobacteriaceae bacterium]
MEQPVFLKVLGAVPADKVQYKPHERSPSAEQLVWTLTSELRPCLEAVKEGRAEWRTEPAPPLDKMISMFEAWYDELTDRVASMDDAAWDRKAQFYYQGKMVSEQLVSEFLWMILFDAIHHRGQLTTYLRPMGSKVPAIYGPSGDERS